MPRLAVLVVLLIGLPLAAIAERRVALVIGNDVYSDVVPLNKAVADADAVATALKAQGFQTMTAINADRREMNRSISRFTGQLQPGDTAVLFYAGHGVEIDGENYLLPTDIVAPASGERDFIKSESIALSALLDRVRATGARMTIAIMDACRNNPFETATGRSIGGTRGLGRITAPQGTFVIFSAGAGQLALDELTEDDPARNSVFTRALLPRLSRPGLELRDLVSELRIEVRRLARTVNHQQFPAYYDELLGEFYFARAEAAPVPATAEGAASDTRDGAATPRMAALPADQMRQDFELARSIGTDTALQAFLERYDAQSDSFAYRMAEQLLKDLEESETETPREPLQTPPDGQDRRTIIRDTQRALNAAGCSAGGEDGIVGARTRSAFQRFIADTGAELREDELGSARALAVLRASADKRCKTVLAQPAPEPPAGSTGFDLSGTWQFRAKCPLFIQTTGTVRYQRAGANIFTGRVSDSLGQTATTRVTLDGRKMTFVFSWPQLTTYASGTLAADGNSYSNAANNGCVATAWRAG